jgi:DNA polymerase-4
VEQRDFPELRGKPVAVGGARARGVVASASYEARRYGVRSAMPGMTARRLCPELIFVKARFEVYQQVSEQIREIFLSYTDLIEPLSLDEAYLDVTAPKQGPLSATLIAEEIRQRIVDVTGLTASAGVSFNKFLAKVASDINKPNGMKVITPAEAADFLDALPVSKFHGIGEVTAKRMQRMGISTGADLKRYDEVELVWLFGKVGRHYYRIVRADDQRPVNPHRLRKSIGAERTFSEDLHEPAAMREKVSELAALVFRHMSEKQNFGRTVTLKLKTPDFRIFNRSRSFSSELRRMEDLEQAALGLLEEHAAAVGPVRLLGVAVSNLEREQLGAGIQLLLDFGDEFY